MGGQLSIGSYSESSSVRLQHRMRDSVHQILYMWLRADYNEQQYLANPDTGDTYIASSSINSWSWWQPTLYSLDAMVGITCTLWLALLLFNTFVKTKKAEDFEEEAAETTADDKGGK